MIRCLCILVIIATLAHASLSSLPDELVALRSQVNGDPYDVSISGVSSGALAAVQYHVAYSKTTRGVGTITCVHTHTYHMHIINVCTYDVTISIGVWAGGPYYVAQVCTIPVSLPSPIYHHHHHRFILMIDSWWCNGYRTIW